MPVSYTHLDVYKRQAKRMTCMFYGLALSIKPGLGMVESGVMMESTSLSPEYPSVRKSLQKRLALLLCEVKEPESVPYARHPVSYTHLDVYKRQPY